MKLHRVFNRLAKEVELLTFNAPVALTYNPLVYAKAPFKHYLDLYGEGPKEVVLLGMNPGPWGMVQTGIPFGEVHLVQDWLKIEGRIRVPESTHPKRPVLGFSCKRSEVSGRRLWGWARNTYQSPTAFFQQFLVLNYCPLAFFDEGCKNITPDKLKAADRTDLFRVCDKALAKAVRILNPQYVVGVGNFAEGRIKIACQDLDVCIGRITHPSPANPKANRGWVPLIENELHELGIRTP